MDKLDFAILNVFHEHGALTRLQAISRKQILEEVTIGGQNLFLRLKRLVEQNIVSKGLKDGREHTFFITEEGLEIFRRELG